MYETELYTLCDLNENGNGDDYHYIMICPYFRQSRKLDLKDYFYTRSNLIKFDQLVSSDNKSTLSKYIVRKKLLLLLWYNSKNYPHFIIVSMLLSAISIILFYAIYNSCSLFVYMW